MDILGLEKKNLSELRSIAQEMSIPRPQRHKKEGLILLLAKAMGEAEGLEIRGESWKL